jgi:hypothetical protein
MVSIAADATNQPPHAMGERDLKKLASSKTATLLNPRVAVSVFGSDKLTQLRRLRRRVLRPASLDVAQPSRW